MPEVSLRAVTAENWQLVCRLQVGEEQQRYVAPNWYSLLQAIYGFSGELAALTLVPLAIYADERPVGLVLYNTSPDRDRFFIMRLMVDRQEQSKGYGRAALQQLLAQFRQLPQAKEVAIGYIPGNQAAERLYGSLGFEAVGLAGEGEEQEMIAVLDLNEQPGSWQSLWRK